MKIRVGFEMIYDFPQPTPLITVLGTHFPRASDDRQGVIIMVVCLMAAYIAPAFVAHIRHHRNASAIMALNVLLGWTILGWVIALVWALTDNVKPD